MEGNDREQQGKVNREQRTWCVDKGAVLPYVSKRNRARPVTTTRASLSPVVARQDCSNEAGPKLSQELKPADQNPDQQGTWSGTDIAAR